MLSMGSYCQDDSFDASSKPDGLLAFTALIGGQMAGGLLAAFTAFIGG
jgi:hypothetical protein